jgi:glutamine amidotransferase
MIAIIDYDFAGAMAVKQVLDALGVRSELVRAQAPLERASQIILPNGDSFAAMIRALRDWALVRPIYTAIDRGVPVLGIGIGMHLFLDVSYQDGQHTGLGVIPGKATHFDLGAHPVAATIPPLHRGWSAVTWRFDCPLLAGLRSGESFFFDHSVHAEPLDSNTMCGICNRGVDFSAVIWHKRIFGTQFLPEKSSAAGSTLLQNFSRI